MDDDTKTALIGVGVVAVIGAAWLLSQERPPPPPPPPPPTESAEIISASFSKV